MSKVFVRWYKEVVEGTIVRENDMFGMTVVEIPIQGVKVLALFNPKNVFKTPLEAHHDYPVHLSAGVMYPFIDNPGVGEFISNSIEQIKVSVDLAKQGCDKTGIFEVNRDLEALHKFKHEHWNHERNMLELDYWEEYDRMFHAYARKRFEMMRPQQPQHLKTMKIETPATPDEALKIIPSTGNAPGDYFYKVYRDACEKIHKKDQAQVVPRTIGKKVTVTELTLF